MDQESVKSKVENAKDSDVINDEKYKVFLFTAFPYTSTILEAIFGWTKKSIFPFSKTSDLIEAYRKTPFPVIAITDSHDEIADLAREVLGSYCGDPLILLSFTSQDRLIKQFRHNQAFPDFENCINNNLIVHLHLPCMVDKLISCNNEYFQNRSNSSLTDKQKKIVKNITALIADKRDADQRHGMGNYKAADRILNGACRSGDYDLFDKEVCKRVAGAYHLLLCGYHKNNNERIAEELHNIEEMLLSFINEGEKGDPSWPNLIKKILIIDDEEEMWKPVWDFMIGSDKIVFSATYEAVEEQIKTEEFDCVILDINLSGEMNGIDILQKIKNKRFDLPVIMTTACDHSYLAKTCLKYGADGYFVKELSDKTDRDSVDYYNSLKTLLLDNIIHYRKFKDIWKRYSDIESQLNDIDKKYQTEICTNFKKAYYFLTLKEKNTVAESLLVPGWIKNKNKDSTTKNDTSVFYLIVCAEEIFIAKWLHEPSHHGMTYDDALSAFDITVVSTKGIPRHLNLNEKAHIAFPKIANKRIYTLSNSAGARHAFYSLIEKPFSEQTAIDCANEIIGLLNKLPKEKKTSNNDSQFEPIKVDINKYLLKDSPVINTHSQRTIDGAKLFETALTQANNLRTYNLKQKILFIDDQVENSPWYNALKLYFEIKKISFDVRSQYDSSINLNDYNLILLDLVFMMSCEEKLAGLQYLEMIRIDDISIPIIMLTADNSAFNTKRCLYKGADDYFVKESISDSKEYFEEFDRLMDKYLSQGIDTCRREWWRVLKKIDTTNFGLDNEDLYNKLIDVKRIRKEDYPLENFKIEKYFMKSPLYEAYYYYLIHINDDYYIDYWRVKKLLLGENIINAFYLSLGKFVEYILWNLSFCQNGKKDDAGHLVNKLFFPLEEKQFFKKIWDIRRQAKIGKIIDNDPHIISKELFGVFQKFVFVGKYETRYVEERNRDFLEPFYDVKCSGRVVNKKSDAYNNLYTFIDLYIHPNEWSFDGICKNDTSLQMDEEYNFIVRSFDYARGKLIVKRR